MLRVGVVGAGVMGALHAAGWRQTPAEFAGVFSLYPDMVQSVIGRAAGSRIPTDALIEDVDVVDICAPTHVHYELDEGCGGRKAHRLRKPLARTGRRPRR